MPELILPPAGLSRDMLDTFVDDPTKLTPSMLMPMDRVSLGCRNNEVRFDYFGRPDVVANTGAYWGNVITDLWCKQNPEMGLELDYSMAHRGRVYVRVNGQPVGEIYVVRNTRDGLVLAFPASSTPWFSREVHRDDVAILFGTVIDPLMLRRAGTVHRFLEHCISNNRLEIEVKAVLRLL